MWGCAYLSIIGIIATVHGDTSDLSNMNVIKWIYTVIEIVP